ncbi:hypothetical protein MYP14_06245 [Rhodococcus pyridinivorans]|uniref:hypothetical protein n=1 Tax=Rhodococcus pyridinivorans TaxID=103816 RepID=UPI001FFFEAF6|nr:hypothetical protein [Rhodococcus pyridinivorans]UPK64949.1 hypothetical protein MYP14_06245 [Rhodococcus pyridinivorans]
MSILNRPLTEQELADAGIEPAPIAHETFTQIFAVHDGQLEVLDPFAATPIEAESDESDRSDGEDDTPPKPMGLTPAVVAWIATYGGTIGTLIYLAGGGR